MAKDEPKEEILSPDDSNSDDSGLKDANSNFDVKILALFQNNTNAKEFLEVIEKHNPGFIKKLSDASKDTSTQSTKNRENFSRFQAYFSLLFRIIFGGAVFGLLTSLVIKNGELDFFTIIGLAILFAITQGGSQGFRNITAAIVEWIKNR